MTFFLFRKTLNFLALAAGLMMAVPGFAQYSSDIDIYGSTSASGDLPNVLFVLDNSANWNANNSQPNCYYKENGVLTTTGPSTQGKKSSIEQCALYNVIDALPTGSGGAALFNIGFMVFNDTNVNTGARPIKAFTPLTAAGKDALKTVIKKLTDGQSPSPTSFALAMHEAYLYYAGAAPYAGQRSGTPPYDPAAFLSGNYVSPSASSCGRNYVIIIANGPPQGDWNNISNDDVKSMLKGLGGDTTPITYTTGYVDPKDAANWTDEYARFLLGRDVSSQAGTQNIVTYSIAVTGAKSDQATYPNIFRGIAKAGGGDFYEANNVDNLTLALTDIFNQLQAVNSVFASASLPVSVNARGTYLNQIFMGMFRPDGQARPRWRGNLKQYQFGYDPTTDSLFLSGADNKPAISGATGFLSPSAVSFWTTPSSYWINQPLGTPPTSSDSADGEVVEKGGVAQRIREVYASSQDARNVYTCISCAANTNLADTSNSATKFSTANTALTATTTALGVTDPGTLINWVRGTDNNSPTDEQGPGATTTIRPSVHGDVLHSRPAVVNYGGSTGVVVFYGANDGALHAINGNQTGATAGNELWSFIPQEQFLKLNRLRINSPEIRLSTTIVGSTNTTTTPTPRGYFVDGPIGIYQKVSIDPTTKVQTVDKVILYVAMRRGGRVLYALDVTNPSAPTFLWKKTDSDISVLGQTWSEPKVAKIRGNANPVIIMGAGYDPVAEDGISQGTTTMGNAVLVLDAITGSVLKTFATDRSVPSDVSLIDTDFDGYVDRAYAVDMGGNVYRIDLEKTTTTGTSTSTSSLVADWGMYKLAALTGSATSSFSGTRKFFYPPDVVLTPTFAAVLVGSGDREKPLATASADAFFTVKDFQTTKGTHSPSFTPITQGNLGQVGTTQDQTAGCYIPMSTSGEKIVNAPVSVGGVTYFSTNKPSAPAANSCSSNLGVAKVYSAPLFCGTATSQVLVGGGLPPSPVTGTVTVSYISPLTKETVTKQVPFIIGAPNSKGSGIEGSKVTPIITPVRKRRYWYLENVR
jgi:type IV pilus assembly protein PilY1